MTVSGTGTYTEANRSFTTTLQKSAYSYDSVGNVASIYESVWGETQAFGYDSLNRLTSASATDGLADYNEAYQYDPATGNLVDKNGLVLDYPDPDEAHPHAVTSAGSNTYGYDDNGNQTTRVIGGQTVTLSYDTENRLVSASGTNLTANFTYDGDGRRVKSVVNGETILFAGGHYELKGNEVSKYYFAGASRIAVRKYTVPQSSTLTYLAGDHLGSTSLAVDASTGDVVQTRYKPWGEVRYTTPSKTLPTRYTFTGQYSHVSDEATDLGNAGFGLMFYNARWYDHTTGRFAQADTVVPGGVQGLDRYAYVNNNPINHTDPSGLCEDETEYYCRHDGGDFFLEGSPEDIQATVDILNAGLEGTGYTVSADRYGRITLTQTGDPTGNITLEQKAQIKYLSKYINSGEGLVIKVVSGTEIPFGDFDTETIDIQDIDALGEGPGMSSVSTLFHELEEQYAKQVLGIEGYDSAYDEAHFNHAIPAEEAVAGALRIDFVEPGFFDPHPIAIVGYDYGQGNVVCTQFTYDPFTIYEYECSYDSYYP